MFLYIGLITLRKHVAWQCVETKQVGVRACWCGGVCCGVCSNKYYPGASSFGVGDPVFPIFGGVPPADAVDDGELGRAGVDEPQNFNLDAIAFGVDMIELPKALIAPPSDDRPAPEFVRRGVLAGPSDDRWRGDGVAFELDVRGDASAAARWTSSLTIPFFI